MSIDIPYAVIGLPEMFRSLNSMAKYFPGNSGGSAAGAPSFRLSTAKNALGFEDCDCARKPAITHIATPKPVSCRMNWRIARCVFTVS